MVVADEERVGLIREQSIELRENLVERHRLSIRAHHLRLIGRAVGASAGPIDRVGLGEGQHRAEVDDA